MNTSRFLLAIVLFFCLILARAEVNYLPIGYEFKDKYSFINENDFILLYRTKEVESSDKIIQKLSSHFLPLGSLALNFGPTDNFFWIALPIKNENQKNEIVHFTLKNSAINRIRSYWVEDGEVLDSAITGDELPFECRPYPFCSFTFPLELKRQGKGFLLLELDKRNENFFCAFDLHTQKEFHRFELRTYWVFGIFSGLILLSIVVNVFLYISFFEKIHLWYSIYAFSNLFLLMSYEGLDFQFFYPNWPLLSNLSRYFTTSLTYIFIFQIFLTFLSESRHKRKIENGCRVVQFCHLLLIIGVCIVFRFYSDTTYLKILLFRLLSILSLISLLLLLIFSFVEMRKSRGTALLFFIGIFLLFLGSIEYLLNINGLYTGIIFFETAIPSNLQIFVVLEVLVVFLAIFYRYKKYRYEAWNLQNKLLQSENRWYQQMLSGVFDERNRIAKDIHDGIGSKLFGSRMKLEMSLRTSENVDEVLISEAIKELTEINSDLRDIVWSLSTTSDGDVSLLQKLILDLNRLFYLNQRELKSELYLTADVNPSFLLDLQLMVMEMSTNFSKYSLCLEVSLILREDGDSFIFEWREKNPLESKNSYANGLGLKSIDSRLNKWNGVRDRKTYPFDYVISFPLESIRKKEFS